MNNRIYICALLALTAIACKQKKQNFVQSDNKPAYNGTNNSGNSTPNYSGDTNTYSSTYNSTSTNTTSTSTYSTTSTGYATTSTGYSTTSTGYSTASSYNSISLSTTGQSYNTLNSQYQYNTQYNTLNSQYNTLNTQYQYNTLNSQYNTQYNTTNSQFQYNTQYNTTNTQFQYNTQYNTTNTQFQYNTQYNTMNNQFNNTILNQISTISSQNGLFLSGAAVASASTPENELLKKINQARAAGDLSLAPMQLNPVLSAAAQTHAKYLQAIGYRVEKYAFASHEAGGKTFNERMTSVAYAGQFTGENWALGADDSAAVMNLWLNSTLHKANILEPTARDIGIAIVREQDGAVHYLTIFAAPK